MSGIIGKKLGMTSFFDQNGKNIPCTLVQAGPCIVTQVKTVLFSWVMERLKKKILPKR